MPVRLQLFGGARLGLGLARPPAVVGPQLCAMEPLPVGHIDLTDIGQFGMRTMVRRRQPLAELQPAEVSLPRQVEFGKPIVW